MAKCPTCKKGTPLWFISWADMATLLLCFFVILYSMSVLNATKFEEMKGSLKDAFGVEKSASLNPVSLGISVVSQEFRKEVQLVKLVEKLKIMANSLVDNGEAAVEEDESGIYMTLPRDALFKPGTLELHKVTRDQLTVIAGLLQGIGNEVQIRGGPDHSPPPPLAGLLNPWASGMVEAQAVAAFLVGEGGIDGRRVRVVSYGEKAGGKGKGSSDGESVPIEIAILRQSAEGMGELQSEVPAEVPPIVSPIVP
ncbi:MAG: hypothetical protein HQL57_10435 [Magnetococcales bacterium]|nr:hypothetical protein [Magnetococcales bacterium]MBF0157589.1 hypothetical protein [Magnetococcales bacterium]